MKAQHGAIARALDCWRRSAVPCRAGASCPRAIQPAILPKRPCISAMSACIRAPVALLTTPASPGESIRATEVARRAPATIMGYPRPAATFATATDVCVCVDARAMEVQPPAPEPTEHSRQMHAVVPAARAATANELRCRDAATRGPSVHTCCALGPGHRRHDIGIGNCHGAGTN